MDFGNSVNAVTADDGQMGHMHFTGPQDSYGSFLTFISIRMLFTVLFHPTAVDFLYNKINPRQEILEHFNGPPFQSFWQDCMNLKRKIHFLPARFTLPRKEQLRKAKLPHTVQIWIFYLVIII